MIPKIHHFSFLFGSWAAPGASRSDFGRSQSAPGALWELFEIISSFQNRHFDALGRSWGPPGALLDLGLPLESSAEVSQGCAESGGKAGHVGMSAEDERAASAHGIAHTLRQLP